jgi:hypothetical protein
MWLAYGERLPRHLRRANAVAIALTLAAMAGTGFILRRRGHDTAGIAAGVGLAWLAGHMAWGSYFAAHVSASTKRANQDASGMTEDSD